MNQKNCSSTPTDAPPSTLRWAVLLGLKPIGCFTKPVLQAALLLAPMFAVHAADAPTFPGKLYDLAADLGETNNLAATQPARVTAMRALMERLITDGRSTPGIPQRNDVEVRRFPLRANPQNKP